MPACVASSVQFPPAATVTVAVDTPALIELDPTVHTPVVLEVKLTVSPSTVPPDIAVALIVNGALPKVTLGNWLNVIVCDAPAIVNVWITGEGAAQFVVAA